MCIYTKSVTPSSLAASLSRHNVTGFYISMTLTAVCVSCSYRRKLKTNDLSDVMLCLKFSQTYFKRQP